MSVTVIVTLMSIAVAVLAWLSGEFLRILKGTWRGGAETSLFMSWDFRLAILTPLVVAIGLAVGIASAESLVLTDTLTKDSIQTALEHFRLPLGVLALAFPFAAMVASNLRSVQAVHQMELQQSQNNFANHYLHLEKFTEQMELHCNPPIDENSPESQLMYRFSFRWQRVHSFFYPHTRKGHLFVPWTVVAFVEEMIGVVEKAAIEVHEFGDTEKGDYVKLDFFIKFTDYVNFMLVQFGSPGLKSDDLSYWTRMMSDIDVVLSDLEAGLHFDMPYILTVTHDLVSGENLVDFKGLCTSGSFGDVNQFTKMYSKLLGAGRI